MLAAALCACSPAQGDALFDLFVDPPSSAHPWARWWWPGGAVQDDELRREIRLLKQSGFAGAEIQPFNVNLPHLAPEELARINDYANPAFFAHLAAAAAEAHAQGLQIDDTFGSAWPSGGGFAVTPELALGELTMSVTNLDAPTASAIKVDIPPRTRKFLPAFSTVDPRIRDPRVADWPARFDARQGLVAIIAVKGSAPVLGAHGFPSYPWHDVSQPGALEPGSAVNLTHKLRPDGTVDWSPPPGHWQILAFKHYAVDASIGGGVGAGPQLVLDHFSKDAFDAHARRVGDPLDAIPPAAHAGLRATFVDSLEIFPDIYWSDGFLDAFRSWRGYDLTPYLPLIVQPGWMEAWTSHYSPPYFDMPDIGERVRADYRQTVSDLMIENFVRPFVGWNHAHHLLSRYQAHGAPVDILKAYGLADMPETEDLMASADTHFLRLARSAADLYGRDLVSAESLCWRGHPFDITPAQWRQRADLLFVSGVTQIVEHGVPYTLHPEQWPGWHPFGPSAFTPGFSSFLNPANPFWAAVPELNRYIARMQTLLRAGRNDVRVALYYGDIGYYPGIEDHGADAHLPGKALMAGGYDYDRINDDALSLSHMENGALVTPGGVHFGAIVVPPARALPVATARTLANYAHQGLKLVFIDQLPDESRGLQDHGLRDAEVKGLLGDVMAHGGQVVPAAGTGDALRKAGVKPNLTFSKNVVLFNEKQYSDRVAYFLHNEGTALQHVEFTTDAKGGAERWDAWNGTRASIPVEQSPGQGTRVSVDLDSGKSALIVFDSRAAPATAQPQPQPQRVTKMDGAGWNLAVDGHGHLGRKVQTRMALLSLTDWRDMADLADIAGQGTYRRHMTIDPAQLGHGKRVLLDLGTVHDIAALRVNGVPFPLLVEAPYVTDITSVAKGGDNLLEVTVSNALQNAMIDLHKSGFRSLKSQPAGLIGPVTLQVQD